MTKLSMALGFSRQNFYKTYLNADLEKLNRSIETKTAIEEVLSDKPGLSGTKVRQVLTERGIKIGRDKFYAIVKRYKLTANACRKAWKKTHMYVRDTKNLVIKHTWKRACEVLVSDYTEIKTAQGKLQLLLVMDLFSRRILSYRISQTSVASAVVEAIKESLSLKSSLGLRYRTIFHTDKGSEFVNRAVRNLAESEGLLLSNTGKHHCYENAFIESLNRTLKYSLGLRTIFPNKETAIASINEAINTYNTQHSHRSLGKRTPDCVLMNYTASKVRNPKGKTDSCPTPGGGAKIYSNSLAVKVKTISLDNKKKPRKT